VKWQSILAIYVLFWTLALFVVLPLGVRTPDEVGEALRPGHAPSAPHHFSLAKAALRATIVSALVFGAFYANYVYGWVTIETVDWTK
jgi:predicted secreted protein